MLGVVRHDNGVRVPSPIREERLAVVRWRNLSLRSEGGGGRVPAQKMIPKAGTLGWTP
jgi:hypothetical protein